ncbi:MAG: hypothetical protein MJA84_07230 [Firmicutes bacterium]|nr:hypothetical protein [Bacillota bacterium]
MDSEKKRHVTSGVVIDSAKVNSEVVDGKTVKIVPDGMPLGKITASGKYCPLKATKVLSGGGSGVVTCVLEETKNFQVGDAITIGGHAATIDTVNYDTGAITWTGALTIADSDAVICTDGSGVAALILAERANVTDGDGIFGAIDMARVKEARLPVKLTAASKAELKMITFA